MNEFQETQTKPDAEKPKSKQSWRTNKLQLTAEETAVYLNRKSIKAQHKREQQERDCSNKSKKSKRLVGPSPQLPRGRKINPL